MNERVSEWDRSELMLPQGNLWSSQGSWDTRQKQYKQLENNYVPRHIAPIMCQLWRLLYGLEMSSQIWSGADQDPEEWVTLEKLEKRE